MDGKEIEEPGAKNNHHLREVLAACTYKPVEDHEKMLSWIEIQALLHCLKGQSTEVGLERYEKNCKEQCVLMTELAFALKSTTQDLKAAQNEQEKDVDRKRQQEEKRADDLLKAKLSNMNPAERAAHMLQVRQGKFTFIGAVQAPKVCGSLEAAVLSYGLGRSS